jgi:hypothetical protein
MNTEVYATERHGDLGGYVRLQFRVAIVANVDKMALCPRAMSI